MTRYFRMMSTRKYLPEQVADAAELETIVRKHTKRQYAIDVMTDQIDVYVNGRRIATYMAM